MKICEHEIFKMLNALFYLSVKIVTLLVAVLLWLALLHQDFAPPEIVAHFLHPQLPVAHEVLVLWHQTSIPCEAPLHSPDPAASRSQKSCLCLRPKLITLVPRSANEKLPGKKAVRLSCTRISSTSSISGWVVVR